MVARAWDDDSGELAYVIIKHVGDAAVDATTTPATPVNRNALNLRSVGAGTTLNNIEVYSVDGSGIWVDGGGADLSNVLVYNPQEQGVLATGGYLGLLDGVLVSQADGAGTACVQVVSGAGGATQAQIDDGMNTRVTARNLTCDVSADNAGGAGVNVLEGARARIQNAIIVGSRVAANATSDTDNVCLNLVGTLSIIEADGVIASCLEDSTNVTAANFLATAGVAAQVIATDAATPTAEEVAMDVQFHAPGVATTISPLATPDPGLVVLSDAGTLGTRALFSLPLSESRVNAALTTAVVSAAGVQARTYLGAIATANNPFSGWTFGVFGTPPPVTPPTPPPPAVGCASYTSAGGDDLTATAVPTTAAPNCVYEASFVDNGTPLTADLTLANLPDDGVHVFNGSLVVGAASATLADVPGTPVVLTIEAGATIAFANAADQVVINRGAQIMAVGTAANPITFTSLADVNTLATADTTDDLAATATDQWAGISINGQALNNTCSYSDPAAGAARRPFEASDPFTLAAQPTLTTAGCGRGDATDGFHGGVSPDDDSGELAYVIIKHVGAAGSALRNGLDLRSVGTATAISNIEVYSVDGSGIVIEGGGADLSNVLVYNPQRHGILATNGYLGVLDGVLVSQADGLGLTCVRLEAGTGGSSEAQITDGMNTRVTLRNFTCDVSANNGSGAGVRVREGARIRLQNAIIVGSRVAADASSTTDNACLNISGARSIIEADGVIASCLEASINVTAANFVATTGNGARVIATDADATSPTADEVAMDVQIFTGTVATSPLAGINSALVLLSSSGTQETRALFSLLLNGSSINGVAPTVVASSATPSRTYLGAITTGDNPFSTWTFGVFTAP